jgi:hypothetical protein
MPKGLKPNPGCWVYHIKDLIDGTFKYKARWALRGKSNQARPLLWGDLLASGLSPNSKHLIRGCSSSRLVYYSGRRGAGIPKWKS